MKNIKKSCFFTGHRFIPKNDIDTITDKVNKACIDLISNYGVTDFICGGALGFDTLAAKTVLDLKSSYPQIRLHIYLPCLDQASRWNKYDAEVWDMIRNMADEVVYTAKMKYFNGCMQIRNHAMAKDAYYCIAYCTRNRGGTYSTIKYAKELDRDINIIT